MAFELWMVTAAANAVMVVIYGAIAMIMIRGIVDGRQWSSNPIATATAAIFVACTVGHGIHFEHTVLPVASAALGFSDPAGAAALTEAARASFSDPRLVVWDVVTAGVAIWYWTLRSRFAIITGGAALCEDLAKREAQALELHDNVVQGLVRAKLALDLGRRDEGAQAVESTLDAAKGIITGLLGTKGKSVVLGAGDLRRNAPGR